MEGLIPSSLYQPPTPMRRLLRLPVILHRALLRALDHDCLNLAQSTAYSAMVSLFPALIVAAAIISLLPDSAPFRFQLSLLQRHPPTRRQPPAPELLRLQPSHN